MTKLIAEANSYNSLADILDISVGSVRNNMGWHKGMSSEAGWGSPLVFIII